MIRSPKEKLIHFGARGMSDYTIHKDDERKKRYLIRHKNDYINNPEYAGFYATNILWNKKTLDASISDTNRRYGLKIKNKTK